MQRVEKEQVVSELQEQFAAVQGAVLTDFRGLSVKAVTEIRRAFRDEGVSFRVVKNTLARLAVQGTPLEVLKEDFVGPIAIAYSDEDAVAPAKVAKDCAKKEAKFEIKCGYVDQSRIDEKGVDALAQLPGRDELRAQLLSVMNGPATKLVRTFNAVPQQIAILLSAFENKRKEEGEG